MCREGNTVGRLENIYIEREIIGGHSRMLWVAGVFGRRGICS